MQKSNLLQQTPDNGDDCFQHQGADQGEAIKEPAEAAADSFGCNEPQRLGQKIQYKPKTVRKQKAPLRFH